jgi:hypothetical protein
VKNYPDDKVNAQLRAFFKADTTTQKEMLKLERQKLETEIAVRIEKRRKKKCKKDEDTENNEGES